MGDDRAGLAAAELLRQRALPRTVVELDEAPGGNLATESPDGVELLIIIDAARADERHPTGTLERFDYREGPPIAAPGRQGNTHGLSVDTGLELGNALGVLPQHVWIYVLFGEDFGRKMGAGEAIDSGVIRLADRVERDVRDFLGAGSCTN
jgi:hydrogenase maturation protease